MSTENEIYWAHQSPEVRSVLSVGEDNSPERKAKCFELAAAGYQIDVPIMLWGWGPDQTMLLRKQYGYTWTPSALQNPTGVAPGLMIAGYTSYDPAHPPAGSILVVSPITEDAYPPFDKPLPAPPAPGEKSPIGDIGGGVIYNVNPKVPQPAVGTVYEHDPRGRFQLYATATMMGASFYWKKIA